MNLLPAQWRDKTAIEYLRIYNPAIVHHRGRLLMAYRIDFGYDKPLRVAVAICELDARLQVVPDSVVALSDTIRCSAENHFDARFLVFDGRLFIHYNNNWDTAPNRLFLVELDQDTLEARAPARLLNLMGERQPIEKNWMLFAHDEELFAIYQVDPHVVLRVDLAGAGPVCCRPGYHTVWETKGYTRRYGALRGGTPPVRVGANYVSVFHSRTHTRSLAQGIPAQAVEKLRRMPWLHPIKRWFREQFDPVRYYGGVYVFAAEPPFTPTFMRPTPILWPEREGRRRHPTPSPMAPRRVVYPCGLVRLDDDRWLVSYGIHDEQAALRVFSTQELLGDHQAEAMTAP